ncbi:hypothetical protein VP01_1189g1 [Puccinia sorghi]|uniref:Uncharacterized protein n=1 Tax=Puccinia sorghi TaxID=27349 RepID=A0A0L6VR38_9BASI|nr:hypothetical protein VP01_1189g1 [Puccinia sorghi]
MNIGKFNFFPHFQQFEIPWSNSFQVKYNKSPFFGGCYNFLFLDFFHSLFSQGFIELSLKSMKPLVFQLLKIKKNIQKARCSTKKIQIFFFGKMNLNIEFFTLIILGKKIINIKSKRPGCVLNPLKSSPSSLQKILAQLPAVEMQKVQQSFWCYSHLPPRLFQPIFGTKSLCILHSGCAKTSTHANIEPVSLFFFWHLFLPGGEYEALGHIHLCIHLRFCSYFPHDVFFNKTDSIRLAIIQVESIEEKIEVNERVTFSKHEFIQIFIINKLSLFDIHHECFIWSNWNPFYIFLTFYWSSLFVNRENIEIIAHSILIVFSSEKKDMEYQKNSIKLWDRFLEIGIELTVGQIFCFFISLMEYSHLALFIINGWIYRCQRAENLRQKDPTPCSRLKIQTFKGAWNHWMTSFWSGLPNLDWLNLSSKLFMVVGTYCHYSGLSNLRHGKSSTVRYKLNQSFRLEVHFRNLQVWSQGKLSALTFSYQFHLGCSLDVGPNTKNIENDQDIPKAGESYGKNAEAQLGPKTHLTETFLDGLLMGDLVHPVTSKITWDLGYSPGLFLIAFLSSRIMTFSLGSQSATAGLTFGFSWLLLNFWTSELKRHSEEGNWTGSKRYGKISLSTSRSKCDSDKLEKKNSIHHKQKEALILFNQLKEKKIKAAIQTMLSFKHAQKIFWPLESAQKAQIQAGKALGTFTLFPLKLHVTQGFRVIPKCHANHLGGCTMGYSPGWALPMLQSLQSNHGYDKPLC